MWFKSLSIYKLSTYRSLNTQSLEEVLSPHRFKSVESLEEHTIGWVSPNDTDALVFGSQHQYLIALRVEKRLLPSTVINQATKIKIAEIEDQQGFRPGRKQVKEIKEAVRDSLLPKAFSIYRDTFAWIDTANGWLVIDSGSVAKCDEVIELLSKSLLGAVTIKPVYGDLYGNLSPASAMTNWLLNDEAPEGFTIDQDTELKAMGESRATVRYVRHHLEPEEIKKHIEAGKQCTRLALTWQDKVSFVLTDSLNLKRINPLDVLQDKNEIMGSDDERFASDFTLMTGELAALIKDLLSWIGAKREGNSGIRQ